MRKFMMLFALLLSAAIASASNPPSGHVVSTDELQSSVKAAAAERQSQRALVKDFFGSDNARKALKSARLDYEQVQAAVAHLSDAEIAELASRVQQAQRDFAAGELTNQQITYILIALATAVIVLILV